MSTKKETRFAVEGMSCSSCVHHVTLALRGLQGVGEVEVALKDGKVRVAHDADGASVDAMVEAIREAGYEARPLAE